MFYYKYRGNILSKQEKIMGIFSIAGRLISFAGRKGKYGKLIGKSNNGIKVYQKIGKNGEKTITSFNKNGSIHKEITKKEIKRSTAYENVSGHQTLVKNHDTNRTLELTKEVTMLKQNTSWLNRGFSGGQKLVSHSRYEYNTLKPKNNDFIDGKTSYSLLGDKSWSYNMHERPNISKVTESWGGKYNMTRTYFELNNFKFPGGASHSGRIGYEKGVSPLDGAYLRQTRVNPYGDYLDIKYPEK